jgi:hypothetical protein
MPSLELVLPLHTDMEKMTVGAKLISEAQEN